eukprot:s3630_g1.t1
MSDGPIKAPATASAAGLTVEQVEEPSTEAMRMLGSGVRGCGVHLGQECSRQSRRDTHMLDSVALVTLCGWQELRRLGSKVEAQSLSYGDGVWYPAKVLEVARETTRVKVHFLGFDDDEDEWLPLQSLRPFQDGGWDPPNVGAKVATLPLSELLKAFRQTEQLVQKVQERTGLPKEDFVLSSCLGNGSLSRDPAARSSAALAPPRLEQEVVALKEKVSSLADRVDLPKKEGGHSGSEVELEALQQQDRPSGVKDCGDDGGKQILSLKP